MPGAVGFQIDPGESVSLTVVKSESLFGIVASGTCVVHTLRSLT